MKIRRQFPALFVALLSGALALLLLAYWQLYRQHAQLKATNQVLLEQLDQEVAFRQSSNEYLLGSMKAEVRDEIENQGKKTNEGLLDSLPAFHEITLDMMDSALTQEDWDHWAGELSNIWDKHQLPDEKIENPFVEMLSADTTVLKLRLLRWEREVFRVIGWRLGTTRCWGGKLNFACGLVNEPTVMYGDTMVADLYFWRADEITFYTERTPITYQSSIGEVVPISLNSHLPQLIIPTEGLLAVGEEERLIQFEVTARVAKPWGGYETHQMEGAFWVRR